MNNEVKFSGLLAEMGRHGEKQKDVAKLLGLSTASVCKRLSGETKWTLGDVDILCEHYGKDYYQLFK